MVTLPDLPAIVTGRVVHTRHAAMRRTFSYHSYQWLVDVDALPQSRWPLKAFTQVRASDHIGNPSASIRSNIERFCRAQGREVSAHRIIMLTNARVLGHTFDPLTVFWILDQHGEVECVVAEVHNTYGERHAYLVDVDAHGRGRVDKQFYVSPFFDVAGSYDLRFTLAPGRVAAAATLRRDGEVAFVATFGGEPRPATTRHLLTRLATVPLVTQQTSVLIRVQGIWLWVRRLPIIKRPAHTPQEGTS